MAAYDHRIQRLAPGIFRLSWVVDRKYPCDRLRHPVTCQRIADEDGARRFAVKWKTALPPAPDVLDT